MNYFCSNCGWVVVNPIRVSGMWPNCPQCGMSSWCFYSMNPAQNPDSDIGNDVEKMIEEEKQYRPKKNPFVP